MHLAKLAMLALIALVVAGCGGGSSSEPGTTEPKAGCASVEAPPAMPDGDRERPAEPLDPAKTYTLELLTSCGSFTITLDVSQAPNTTASLVALARAGFFDDTVFHRIVPGFVIQGGDPTQTGSGGSGYQTVDTPPSDARYVKGVVAMAKTAVEPAGTSGSQFFVVTGEDIGLPPDYAIVGTVTAGLDVVTAIGELGDPATELPLQPVVIEKVTVGES